MKNIERNISKQMLKGAASAIVFVVGSFSGRLGQLLRLQSQYSLDLMFGSKTVRRAHYEPIFSLAYHN